MLREALGVVATSVALAPALLAAQVVDAFALGVPGALAALGIAEQPRSIVALAGGRSSAVYELQFARETVVLKHAMTGGSVLAFGARLCGPQPYPGELSPVARVRREVAALQALARAGIPAPRVIAANPTATQDFLRASFHAYDYCLTNAAECVGFASSLSGAGYDVDHNVQVWQTESGLVAKAQPAGTALGSAARNSSSAFSSRPARKSR